MSQKGVGPAHDRIDLTDEERRAIGQLEQALDVASSTPDATKAHLRSRLTPKAHAYYLCMRLRRRAIWLMPVAGVGLALAVTVSVALALVFAALWAIGYAALLTEVGAQFRRVQGRHAAGSRAKSDPNAADGGR